MKFDRRGLTWKKMEFLLTVLCLVSIIALIFMGLYISIFITLAQLNKRVNHVENQLAMLKVNFLNGVSRLGILIYDPKLLFLPSKS